MAHNHGPSSSDDMSMSQSFTFSPSTPLYSTSWTPSSTAAYAGTCIFLVLLSILFRLALAGRHLLESRWRAADRRRRYVVVAGEQKLGERILSTAEGTGARGEKMRLLGTRGVEEDVRVVVARGGEGVMAWRLGRDPVRAGLVVGISAMGYFMMLAVMTYNAGYFLSVLGGIFLGEMVGGRYGAFEDEH